MLLLMIEGKIGLVTGAGQGIGRAIALEMARQGAAAVAVVDRSAQTAAETAELVRDAGTDAEAIVCFLFAVGDGFALQALSEPGRDLDAALAVGTDSARYLLVSE